MIEVERQRAPPAVRLDIIHVMTIVLAGIVDEHVDGASFSLDTGNGLAQGVNVRHVAQMKARLGVSGELVPRYAVDVDEMDL